MSNISLLGSINVCKVNTGYGNKLQSDRFENPNNMLCPLWSGQDNYGRPVNPDSYNTKNAGCNSAADRVSVENFLRPDYMEYVALDAKGFRNPAMFSNNPPTMLYEGFADTPISNAQMAETAQDVKDYYKIVGNAGYQYTATNTPYNNGVCGVSGNPNCMSCSGRVRGNKQAGLYEGYADTQANKNFQNRMNQQFVQSFKSAGSHGRSGMTY